MELETFKDSKALQALNLPWEEPNRYRLRATAAGENIVNRRRPSRIEVVNDIRHQVKLWRTGGYYGATETTKFLLSHWFETEHTNGFKYYYCQREAIETIIWLHEVKQYRNIGEIYNDLRGDIPDFDSALFSQQLKAEDELFPKYCSKVATGAGKTKIMSLAIAWSYFNSIYEPNSGLPRHFVVIAPNLIVFERLVDDFKDKRIFELDPVIPLEYHSDFLNVQVVIGESSGGSASKGTIYVTNIHKLYNKEDYNKKREVQSVSWAGPKVVAGTALKTGERIRQRIALHQSIMVLNDEAHHLHDPESAWNEAISVLNQQSHDRGNQGVALQLDFTATPKHDNGVLFKHIVCDFPLGEAVDSGIVKVPLIGRTNDMQKTDLGDAGLDYREHLNFGYQQYKKCYEEWHKTRKPILFVMTENTKAADEVVRQLDSDQYPLLKGKVLNLHTNLKGSSKKRNVGDKVYYEFVPNEKGISDEDLRLIRQLSRELDSIDSPYTCVVSVLMLREGWDIRNVTTIVPLRPYSSKSNILAEQTLGRGLRRMLPYESIPETVTVVEHPSFVNMYEDELGSEGVEPIVIDVEQYKPQTATIFVDQRREIDKLNIEIPEITDSIHTATNLDKLEFSKIRDRYNREYTPLRIQDKRKVTKEYQVNALLTGELTEKGKYNPAFFASGKTILSLYVKQVEKACGLTGVHSKLAPLIERLVNEVMFERQISLFKGDIDHMLHETEIFNRIKQVFIPAINECMFKAQERSSTATKRSVSNWPDYQATVSDTRPCVNRTKTVFNLVPCDNNTERLFAEYCDKSPDVTSFAKNAGPSKLTIDYLGLNGRKAHYWPDFIIKSTKGVCYVVELKGQVDVNVALKAKSALEWCKTATTKSVKWEYLYVPSRILESNFDLPFYQFIERCDGSLKDLISAQPILPLELTTEEHTEEFKDKVTAEYKIKDLDSDYIKLISDARQSLDYSIKAEFETLGSAFQILIAPLEKLCLKLLSKNLLMLIPQSNQDKQYYFNVSTHSLDAKSSRIISVNQNNLYRILVSSSNSNIIGVLSFCLEFAFDWNEKLGGIWDDVKSTFNKPQYKRLKLILQLVYKFRNEYIAHYSENKSLTDSKVAYENFKIWVEAIKEVYLLIK